MGTVRHPHRWRTRWWLRFSTRAERFSSWPRRRGGRGRMVCVCAPLTVRRMDSKETFTTVIAGGGVAALEAALALRELAGNRVETTLLAPAKEFVYRPMTVREPFAYRDARRYRLDEIARDIGFELRVDSFKWLDPAARVVHTESGGQLHYDALLLAVGAGRSERYEHATTLDDSRLDEQLHGLIQDVEEGYVRSLAFVAPSRMAWPLPLYELALMTAARAYDMNIELQITIVTPEDSPLAVFGLEASAGVQRVLEAQGIDVITSAHAEVPEARRITIHPGNRELRVDRIVALPELYGPSVAGVPVTASGGFIRVDEQSKVRQLDRVYAAGDATDFPVKHGGVAAQQADAAAESIAALAGVALERKPMPLVIRGMLLGADRPLYLSAHLTGTHGSDSQISQEPLWSPATKIAARYLAPYLEARDRIAVA
jgi:sulfide:quinone oxidoreductase